MFTTTVTITATADYVWMLVVFIGVFDMSTITIPATAQVLDSYNLNLDKFKWLDIDIRSDMDAIQSQMKQVTYWI